MKEIIQKYFQAWIDNDIDVVKEIFSDNVVYGECYGAEYRGLDQVLKWFEDWNKLGKVTRWEIKNLFEQGNTVVAEWYFECVYCGEKGGFDGVTIAEFDKKGKIIALREFQSKAEHFFPYGQHKINLP